MSEPGTPTLDQLRVFLTVVDVGSFARAARVLGRATSAVSYSISNLESQLGVLLFNRDATKKPQLSEVGRTVLAEARTVARGVNGLRTKVRSLHQGLEAEVRLVLDAMLPAARVVDACKAFQEKFPTVSLRVNFEVLGEVTQLVLDRTASIGVSGPLPADPGIDCVVRIGIGSVELVPVAAPNHPLAMACRIVPGMAREHVQLVLADRSSLTKGIDFSVVGTRAWRLTDLSAKLTLLREGVGWGNMPLPMVRDDLEAGRLVRLESRIAGAATIALRPFTELMRRQVPPPPGLSLDLRVKSNRWPRFATTSRTFRSGYKITGDDALSTSSCTKVKPSRHHIQRDLCREGCAPIEVRPTAGDQRGK